MTVLKMVLTVLFIIVCLALAVIILLQESKSSGLGAISGAADTYWGKNKGRSMEGKLEKGTKILVVLFFVFTILLNIPSITNTKSDSETDSVTVNPTTDTTTDDSTDVDSSDDAITNEELQQLINDNSSESTGEAAE